ncbi:MAG: hypothetical protein EBZ67_09745 [Chitinophagia bacterium]|nr:hypothetical protein [Chitinophagia bacterium]
MTSPDGVTWTARTSAADNRWTDITYGNGLFVAVAISGTGDRVMTSPDGITWTAQASAADIAWNSVTYGNGLFVAVGCGNGTSNLVMTSPDGITWTLRTPAANRCWTSITYGYGQFVAISPGSVLDSTNLVMTSPDGVTWTAQNNASSRYFMFVVAVGIGPIMASLAYNTVPLIPDGISVTPGSTTASAAFNLPTSAYAPTATNMQHSLDSGATWTTRSPASASSPLAISGLSGNTTYKLRLIAVNSVGNSCPSVTVPFTTSADTDTDGDGILDSTDQDDDNDGILDTVEIAAACGTSVSSSGTDANCDGDTLPNIIDLDSDNDGIKDVVEAGGSDPDDDGRPGTGTPTVNGSGIPTSGSLTPPNSDNASGADPYDTDSDNDGITDGVEDTDKDGTVDPGETDPADADTDNDGIDDGVEDTDKDGTVDSGETDPADADTDNDGLDDGVEDTDKDGTVDPNETDPLDGLDDGVEDTDKDGTVDPGETDPGDADTDNDGIADGIEDADKDGTVDPGETDPRNADTDGDGTADDQEISSGNNPTDPCDPVRNPGYTGYASTNLIWGALDCDGDGFSNADESAMGTDPYSGMIASDMHIAHTGRPVRGNLSVNDRVGAGTTYGMAQADSRNPSAALPVLSADGSYTFMAQVPGTYRFDIPVCPQGISLNCPVYKLEVRVLTPYGNTNGTLANPDRATARQGQPVVVKTLANDGAGTLGRQLNPASVRVITPLNASTQGTASVDPATGDIRFTPANGFRGALRYAYEVCDDQTPTAKCDTGFQELMVLGTGSPNTTFGSDDYQFTFSGTPAQGNVLANDTDAEGDTLRATPMDTVIAGVGRVTLSANGTYSFQPDPAFQGTLSLPYEACSTSGGTTRCAKSSLYVLTAPSPISPTADQTVCHTGMMAGIVLSSNVSGFTSSWTNNKPAIGLPASGTGNLPSFMAVNTGNLPDTATIAVAVSINGAVVIRDTFLIIVTPGMRAGAASLSPSVCVNTAIPSISHFTSRATGIGAAMGLPAGVTASWSANQIRISGTPTAVGTFAYRIPLTGGCAADTARGTITVHPYPQAAIQDLSSNSGVLCGPGQLTLTATGGTSYAWSTGAKEATLTTILFRLTEFTVTVTGEGGCQSTATLRVDVAEPMKVSGSVQNTCTGGATGAIDLSVQGGTAPYRYSWSNRATTQDLTNVGTGTYTVRVDDAYGCSVSQSFIVNGSLAPPVLGISVPEASCEGSPATVVLNPSQAMRISYQIGDAALQTINTLTSPISLNLGEVLTDTDVFVQSAVSLATGCPIAEGSLRRTIKVLRVPALIADNISVCGDERFEIPVRTATPSTRPVAVEWRANYANGRPFNRGAQRRHRLDRRAAGQ